MKTAEYDKTDYKMDLDQRVLSDTMVPLWDLIMGIQKAHGQ